MVEICNCIITGATVHKYHWNIVSVYILLSTHLHSGATSVKKRDMMQRSNGSTAVRALLMCSLIVALVTRFPCLDTFGLVYYQGFYPVAEANIV